NPVVPTLKGIDLIKKARDILAQQKEFIQIAKEKNNEVAGNISMGISEIIAPYITPLFISQIATKYPNLELKLFELSDRRIEDLMINRELDLAIMISPSLKHDYYHKRLYEEEFIIYSTNPLTKNNNQQIDLLKVDLSKIFIHQDLKEILNRKVQGFFQEGMFEVEMNIKYLKGNLETIRNIVDTNCGSMLLPAIAIPYISGLNKNKIFHIAKPKFKLEVSLTYIRGFQKNRIIKHILADLLSVVPEV
ncbi:MAG: LysR family transcriptional regulator substrate-binding protein, partial [Crocinitomicaceae bacterium]|nr:LysR family transcriptional regulator substrate-binding protein [Crocinitomicaceae bacterium]